MGYYKQKEIGMAEIHYLDGDVGPFRQVVGTYDIDPQDANRLLKKHPKCTVSFTGEGFTVVAPSTLSEVEVENLDERLFDLAIRHQKKVASY